MDGQKAISKKRKFVQKGVFYAELNEFLRTELEQEVSDPGYSIGYAGVEVRNTLSRLEVIIKATKTKHVVGTQGRRIRELTSLVKKRFNITGDQQVELFAERVQARALCALAQAEAVKFKLMDGNAVRRACYRAVRFIMENEAKGCEIVVSGKLRGQRAKAMKFGGGYMITSGEATNQFIDEAVKHVKLRQGVLGIKVKIMLPTDPSGASGIGRMRFPDHVEIKDKKKSVWDMDPKDLQKGYAERTDAQVEEQAMGDTEFDQGIEADPQFAAQYEQVAPVGATPMGPEPTGPEPDQQAAQGYVQQPQGGYGQPQAGVTPGGPEFAAY